MRSLINRTILWLLTLLCAISSLSAQHEAESSSTASAYISFTTSRAVGEKVSILFRGKRKITAEGLDLKGATTLKPGKREEYTITSQTIKLIGEIPELYIGSNDLTSIDLTHATQLKKLDCFTGQLNTLDLSGCPELSYLSCHSNQITSLDLSHTPELAYLYCDNNKIAHIDLSQTPEMRELRCYNNQLSELDCTETPEIYAIHCYGNNLSNAAIGKMISSLPDRSKEERAGRIYIQKHEEPHPYTIYQSQLKEANAKHWDLESTKAYELIVTPDPGYITFTTAKAIGETLTLTLYSSEENIAIEGLTTPSEGIAQGVAHDYPITSQTITIRGSLSKLIVDNNEITDIDASQCFGIKVIQCSHNRLKTIKVTDLTVLDSLICDHNQLTELDLKGLKELHYLDCNYNQLAKLDLSPAEYIYTAYCSHNKLIEVNSSACFQLRWLDCSYNQLTELNPYYNPQLRELDCSHNMITSLDLGRNVDLRLLKCQYNQIPEINFSKCFLLETVYCFENPITSVILLQMIPTLPLRGAAGKMYILSEGTPEFPIAIENKHITTAKERGWILYKYSTTGEGQILEETPEGVDSPLDTTVPYMLNGRLLTICKTGSETSARIYSLDGTQLGVTLRDDTLDLSALGAGCYILYVDQLCYPLILR